MRRLRVMEIDDRAKSGEACRRHSWLAGQIMGCANLQWPVIQAGVGMALG